jgi:hypothetical protein
MISRAHWGWVLLLVLVAAAAVVVNASSRRVFILHEGRLDHPVTQAYFAGAEGVLRRASHLKARHQYLDGMLDGCRKALVQISAFNPDVVIAEGLQARHCIARRAPDKVQVVLEPATRIGGDGSDAFVAAWATVIGDLSSHAGPVTLLYSDDLEGVAERELLVQAAALAGLDIQALPVNTDGESLIGPLALSGQWNNLVLVGHSVGQNNHATGDAALRAFFDALHAATAQPIVATRLDRVFVGADIALEQAPEQRGEQMAQLATHALSSDSVAPPLQMAVALYGEFAQRMGSELPAFYLASARLSGFLAAAESGAGGARLVTEMQRTK